MWLIHTNRHFECRMRIYLHRFLQAEIHLPLTSVCPLWLIKQQEDKPLIVIYISCPAPLLPSHTKVSSMSSCFTISDYWIYLMGVQWTVVLTGMKSEPKCLKVCLISPFSGYLLSSAGTVFLLFSSCLSKSLWFSYHRWHWAPVECLERRRKTNPISPLSLKSVCVLHTRNCYFRGSLINKQ